MQGGMQSRCSAATGSSSGTAPAARMTCMTCTPNTPHSIPFPRPHLVYTAPVGLEGVHRMRRRERGVTAARSFWGVRRKPSAGVASTMTGSAPARRAISG